MTQEMLFIPFKRRVVTTFEIEIVRPDGLFIPFKRRVVTTWSAKVVVTVLVRGMIRLRKTGFRANVP